MIAVKEILLTPESLFSNLIITDTVVAYGWMAILVFCSQYQEEFDQKFGAKNSALKIINPSIIPEQRRSDCGQNPSMIRKGSKILAMLFVAYGISKIYELIAGTIPLWGAIFNRFTWVIILATFLPLVLSLTPVKKLEDEGASRIGSFLLYILLASIGARADLKSLSQAPLFIILGFFWVAIHGCTLLVFAKLFKLPLSLLATASQANVGGPISAPLVASIYQKNLAPLGVILGVFGNIYGTYAGLIFSTICRTFLNMLK